MKNILLPTDFSKNSIKAIEYAISLYGVDGVHYVIVNACEAPRGKASVFVSVLDKMIEQSKEGLKKLEGEIKNWDGCEGISTRVLTLKDGLGTNIHDLISQLNIDLIVMGTTGGGDVGVKLMGSNTFQVVRSVNIPVYVVPKHTPIKRPANIALASDLSDLESEVVEKIKHFTQRYSAELDIIKVVPSKTNEEGEQIKKYDQDFEGLTHRFHIIEGTNVAKDLNQFALENNIDLMIMVRKSHTLWERLFSSSATRDMTLSTKVPLLVLHQN